MHTPVLPLTNRQTCTVLCLAKRAAVASCTHPLRTCAGASPGYMPGSGSARLCTALTLLVIAKVLSKVVVQIIVLKYKSDHVTCLLKTLK